MTSDDIVKLVDAVARLAAAVAWPGVLLFVAFKLTPAAGEFIASLDSARVKFPGGDLTATRKVNRDAASEKLRDFWKPNGRVDRSNADRITGCMRTLNITGSVSQLINGGTPEDRARVVTGLSL